jgi:hypothetical protein
MVINRRQKNRFKLRRVKFYRFIDNWLKKEAIKYVEENMGKRKAPYQDYEGNDLHEGDTIIHPSGQRGVVKYFSNLVNPWRVKYARHDRYGAITLALCLQVDNRGQAILHKKERMIRKAPYTDFDGNDLYEFDRIIFPSGDVGCVVTVKENDWRVYIGSSLICYMPLHVSTGQSIAAVLHRRSKFSRRS